MFELQKQRIARERDADMPPIVPRPDEPRAPMTKDERERVRRLRELANVDMLRPIDTPSDEVPPPEGLPAADPLPPAASAAQGEQISRHRDAKRIMEEELTAIDRE